MSIDQQTLAARLKEARANSHLTQDQVAQSLALPRTAVVQIEAGNRSVSTLELAKLSELYGRPIASFFNAAPPVGEEDVLVALFRAADVVGEEQPWQSEVSRYLTICRSGVELEDLLDRPAHVGPPTYDLPQPRRTMEAVDQGNYVAEQERRRLGLGHNPIHDMSDLINSQNVWASGAKLPDQMSGLFLRHSSIGLCILVNFDHPRARKRFSYAHEYAHALLDRHHTATVSLEGNRSDLGEVRANAFAAAFLLPRTGVWAFLQARFKGGPSLIDQTVYDPATEQNAEQVRAHRRAAPRSQALTYEDVAALAHHFGVSYQAALFRLKSLAIVNEEEFTILREKEQSGKEFLQMLQLLEDLDGQDKRTPDREIVSQVLHLALEAYRREEISKGKLRDLSSLLGVPAKSLLNLADAM
jgi:Zn-dependent peptidase ImmA (M78 family)/transcriptional regulator with XRE-family HTH domain